MDGRRIRKIPAPNREEVFVPIQLLTDMDGTEFLLVLTGGQNTAGGLYKIPLYSMSRPLSKVRMLLSVAIDKHVIDVIV